MIVSLKWLRDYVDCPLSAGELATALTMAGLEVEGIHRRYETLKHVVTARIARIEKHPRADRLLLCQVSDGSGEYRVVCGASNVSEGDVVPLALPGAELPSGATIREAEIRGVRSQGMLCSQKELALGEDAAGIWLLPTDIPLGVPLAEALGLEDELLDVSITPNRGDCLSMVGIAREVAAVCGTRVRYPDIALGEDGPDVHQRAAVTVEDPEGCPRYSARLVEGVHIGPSPRWLRERLESAGLRSINNIVDVTNYVLLELGQPLHAFDFDRLEESRIVVRRAAAGERFVTLDGVERTLFDDTLLICDGRRPVAVAGIMGGLDSEIEPETTRVLIESAFFQPSCIRRSSRKLGLRTESSYRFERGVDPEGVIRALDRAAQLMAELGGGRLARGRIDVYPNRQERPEITLRVDRVNRFLGLELSTEEVGEVLGRLEMEATPAGDRRLVVRPPSFRLDVDREVDLAEEVARLVGYNRVPVTLPSASLGCEPPSPHLRMRQALKERLVGAGFFEVLNYSFVSEKALENLGTVPGFPQIRPIRLLNPLSEEQAVMRTSLLPGLLQTARYNFDRANTHLRLFELSRVFLPAAGESLPREEFHCAGVLAGRRDPRPLYGDEAAVDFSDVKGTVEDILDLFHLEKVEWKESDLPPYCSAAAGAVVFSGGAFIGSMGKIALKVQETFDLKWPVFYFELNFDRLFALRRERPMFQPLPRFPFVVRDMAVVVDEDLPAAEPLRFIEAQPEPLVASIEIFDCYRNPQLGTGKKSVGYRLVYRAPDRNLTDEEVNEVHERLVRKVLATFEATLR